MLDLKFALVPALQFGVTKCYNMTAFRYGSMLGLVVLLELACVNPTLAVRWELPVGQLQSVATSDKPWFCHDLDCPSFTVLNRTDSYEVRTYAPGVPKQPATVCMLPRSCGLASVLTCVPRQL